MFVLNFQSPIHEKLLTARKKNCTIRLGDIRDTYPKHSIVWVTTGKKLGPKKKLYKAVIDKVLIKSFGELNDDDLDHQNPEIKSINELIDFFERIYEQNITMDDTVTVIYFSEFAD
ncbi:MAG: ASCH domain-containing protein [Bacillota bacterium]